jgi:hypothetical protein
MSNLKKKKKMENGKLMEAQYQGDKILVDLNQILVNETGTNVAIACYLHCQKISDVKDSRAEYIDSRVINFTPKGRELIETIFKEESLKATMRRSKRRNGK